MGIDRATLYVNPTLGGPEPFLGAVKQDNDLGSITDLTLYSTGAFTADEIRVGTTFADVVPTAVVPEPASVLLISLAGLVGWVGVTMRQRLGMSGIVPESRDQIRPLQPGAAA